MLKKCLGCGHEVHYQATKCPSCQRRDPAERHVPATLKAGVILAFLLWLAWSIQH